MILLRLKFKADEDIAEAGLYYIIRDNPNEKHWLVVSKLHRAFWFKLKTPSNTFYWNYIPM
jgi:hypothetical protein